MSILHPTEAEIAELCVCLSRELHHRFPYKRDIRFERRPTPYEEGKNCLVIVTTCDDCGKEPWVWCPCAFSPPRTWYFKCECGWTSCFSYDLVSFGESIRNQFPQVF